MRVAVILLNLGGPEGGPEIVPFLERFFNDPAVIRWPSIVRRPFSFLVSRIRAPITRRLYALTGGGSTLRRDTECQAAALQKILATGGNFRCLTAMRYSHPFLQEAVAEIERWGADTLVYLPMYPQFSTVTTGSGWNELLRCTGARRRLVPVWSYSQQDGMIRSLARFADMACEEARKQGSPKIIFSAHALPKAFVNSGDPYPEHCRKTATAIVQAMRHGSNDWILSYQSRMGPFRWLGPFTESEVMAASSRKRPIVVVPLTFTTENLETKVDMDQKLRSTALRFGAPGFFRIPAVGEAPEFIEGLAGLVREALAPFKQNMVNADEAAGNDSF